MDTRSPLHTIFALHGSSRSLVNNAPAILDNAKTVILLVSGTIEIFAQRFFDGEAQDARTHLYTAEPGDILFAAPPSDMGLTLLAVGGLESKVIEIEMSHLEEFWADAGLATELRAAVDRFIIGLGKGLTREILPKPRITEHPIPGTPLRLNTQTIAAPRHGVVWISGFEGNSPLFLSQEEIPKGSGEQPSPLFPIPENCWISSSGTATVHFVTQPATVTWDILFSSMYTWCGMVLECVEFNTRMALVDTLNTIHHKRTADAAHDRTSVLRLASVLNPVHDITEPPGEGSTLYKVMSLVGAASGISFTLPVRKGGEKKASETPAEIADLSGIRYRHLQLTNGWWKQDHGPLLAFNMQTNAPMAVVNDVKGNAVVIGADGRSLRLNNASAADLSDEGYIFYKPLPFTPLDGKALTAFAFNGTGKDYRTALLSGFVVGMLGLILPLAAKTFFNRIIPSADLGQLAAVMYAVTGAIVASALLRLAGGLATLRIEAGVEARLETALWDRLLRMPMQFFTKYSSGNIASRGAAFQRIRESLTAGTLVSLTAGVFSLANLLLIFFLDPLLGLTATGLIFIQGLTNWGLTVFRLTALRTAAQIRSRLDGMTLQFISGLHQIRAFGGENRAFARWAALFSEQRALQYKGFQTRNFLRCFNGGFTVLSLAIVFGMAGFSENRLDTGTFVAFYVAFGALQSGILKIIVAFSQIAGVLPQFERIYPILKSIPEDSGTKPDPGALGGKIDVCEVSFRYDKTTSPVLNKVTFSLVPGEFLALVGPSGSGKSTLLRLLIGLDTPDTGSICFDDRDLAELDARQVRRKMGVVLQDFGILPGTIRQTIAGDRFPTEQALWDAAEISLFAPDIKAMDKGLDTPLMRNGNNLSGGQRQKLMIARAVMHDPAILIMDESTSALDNDTQAQVISRLENLKSTRIVAAHRLSTIRNADRIIVLDQGRIVESGDYQSLIAQKGLFYTMAMRQIL